jgi:hypothetical protein
MAPEASNITAGFATEGTWYETFRSEFQNKFGETWGPGAATFQYQNDQRAGTFSFNSNGSLFYPNSGAFFDGFGGRTFREDRGRRGDTALSTSYGWLNRVDTVDPNTSAAWTASAVNALQVGPKCTA